MAKFKVDRIVATVVAAVIENSANPAVETAKDYTVGSFASKGSATSMLKVLGFKSKGDAYRNGKTFANVIARGKAFYILITRNPKTAGVAMASIDGDVTLDGELTITAKKRTHTNEKASNRSAFLKSFMPLTGGTEGQAVVDAFANKDVDAFTTAWKAISNSLLAEIGGGELHEKPEDDDSSEEASTEDDDEDIAATEGDADASANGDDVDKETAGVVTVKTSKRMKSALVGLAEKHGGGTVKFKGSYLNKKQPKQGASKSHHVYHVAVPHGHTSAFRKDLQGKHGAHLHEMK